MNVSFLPNIKASRHYPLELAKILAQIRGGDWREHIEKLRKTPPGPAQDALKIALPSFTASGTLKPGGTSAKFFDAHSGLIQADCDDLGAGKALALRDRLKTDPHVFAAFVSPSGDGTKALVRIPCDPSRHREAFDAVESHFRAKYGVSIDRSCKDLVRKCFVSFDPAAWVNPDAVEIPLPESATESVLEFRGGGGRGLFPLKLELGLGLCNKEPENWTWAACQ